MYWTPKMHKDTIRARFIVDSKKCSTNVISKAFCKAFKIIFNQIQNFYDKSYFILHLNNFGFIEDSKPVLEKTEKINSKANAKAI